MNKEEQKQLIVDIMNEDAKDGLYKQQTAVEWLISQLNKQGFAQVVTDEEIEQAKEMEKEQRKDAFNNGYQARANPKKYYNETFNTNDK
jgi:hypothetical protein